MEILGFRLRSGEDIITEIVSKTLTVEDETIYRIRRPVIPMNVPSVDPNTGRPTQGEALRFLRWMPFAEENHEFILTTKDYVANPYKVWKQLEDYYLEVTSTIKIAQPGQIKTK